MECTVSLPLAGKCAEEAVINLYYCSENVKCFIEPDQQIGSLFIRFFVAVEAFLGHKTDLVERVVFILKYGCYTLFHPRNRSINYPVTERTEYSGIYDSCISVFLFTV